MTERINNPQERPPHPGVPRLNIYAFTDTLLRYAGHYPNMRRDGVPLPSGPNALASLLEEMRITHPRVAERGARMSHQLMRGIGGETLKESPDIMNFQNCYIIGYGLMSESYYLLHQEMPDDVEQSLWFEQPYMETVENVFDGMNMAQLYITEEYPDFVAAIREFVRLTGSDYNTDFSDALTAIAAHEINDAFHQMETARANE